MFIVNTTFSVEPEVEKAWLECLQGQVLPRLRELPYCSGLVFARVLKEEPHPEPGNSYSMQVHVAHAADVDRLRREALHEATELMREAFPGKVYYFRTVLKKM